MHLKHKFISKRNFSIVLIEIYEFVSVVVLCLNLNLECTHKYDCFVVDNVIFLTKQKLTKGSFQL